MRPKIIIYWLLRVIGVFALGRLLTRRQLRILCYHGGSIGDQSRFNPKLFYPDNVFVSRLTWLRKKNFLPVSLSSAVSAISAGAEFSPKSVVLTVDDGWFSSKKAIIDPAIAAGFPITLYVATEVLSLQIPVIDVTVRYILWSAGKPVVDVAGLSGIPDGRYSLADHRDLMLLENAAVAWCKALSRNFPENVAIFLERFSAAMGVPVIQLDMKSRRFHYLTNDELLDLSRAGCAVELHGHTHKYFHGRPDLVAHDIRQCREILIKTGLAAPNHYCYPSGEYDGMAAETLARLGVISATTCTPGLTSGGNGSSPYYLPRFLDGGNVSMIEFEAEMSGIGGVIRSIAAAFPISLRTRR